MSIFVRRVATIVSWVGHPLVLVTLTVGLVLATQLASGAVWLLVALFLAVIAPMGVLLFLGVRSGRWRDADVSVREERKRFYPVAIPLSAFGAVAMWMIGAPHYILRGGLMTLLLLMISAVTNIWFKLSLHTLFASYCTVILFRVSAIYGLGGLALTLLIFWGRLYLARHTFWETSAGVALGLVGGICTAWVSI
jgi:hypothetical protein